MCLVFTQRAVASRHFDGTKWTRMHIRPGTPSSDDALLDDLQRRAFAYFDCEVNPLNGLVADKTARDWPASIAATGMALASYPVAVERGLMKVQDALACP